MTAAFVNEQHLELRRAQTRERLLAAGAELLESLPLAVPLLVGRGDRDGSEVVPGRM